MIRKRTTNQLKSTPIRIPKTRASWIELPPNMLRMVSDPAEYRERHGLQVVDAPGGMPRDLHVAARHHDRERRAAGHPEGARLLVRGPPVGCGRVCAGARGPAARLRLARRPARAPPHLCRRPVAVRPGVSPLRPRRV